MLLCSFFLTLSSRCQFFRSAAVYLSVRWGLFAVGKKWRQKQATASAYLPSFLTTAGKVVNQAGGMYTEMCGILHLISFSGSKPPIGVLHTYSVILSKNYIFMKCEGCGCFRQRKLWLNIVVNEPLSRDENETQRKCWWCDNFWGEGNLLQYFSYINDPIWNDVSFCFALHQL